MPTALAFNYVIPEMDITAINTQELTIYNKIGQFFSCLFNKPCKG